MTPKTSSVIRKSVPIAFGQHNQNKFQRVVQLTQQAIARLESTGKSITLAALAETTRAFDVRGKGITSATILRNPEACALFRQHSPAYQRRQQQVKQVKRKHSQAKVSPDIRATYRGLRTSDLIQMIEDLKHTIADARTQQAKLQAERDEAYQLRGEALQQNTLQLAALTKLQGKANCTSSDMAL